MDHTRLLTTIDNLKEALAFLESLRAPVAETTPTPPAAVETPKPPKPPSIIPAEIRLLLESPSWPEAVDPTLIGDTNSQDDLMERADGILKVSQLLPLTGKRFLDFGCGEGHVVKQAKIEGATTAVGYDIVDSKWNNAPELTTNLTLVRESGPYDAIVLYDVIDHIVNDDPGAVLKTVTGLLAPGGKIFARCNPWCSRHGAHLYRQLNKAYLHLVLNDPELKELDLEYIPTRRIIHPLITYRKYFETAGLAIAAETITTTPVESIFKDNPHLSMRIKSNWRDSVIESIRTGEQFPEYQMSQDFVDYTLTKS